MIRPHRDEHGRLRAGAEGALAALGDFLETEIGENPAAFDELSGGLELVRLGQRGRWEFHGNVYTLRLSPEGARITNALDRRAPSVDLPLPAVEGALLEWRRCWPGPP